MSAALPPCRTCGCGSASFGQIMAAALPRLLSQRIVISCRWDPGGDGHRWIMAKPMSPSDRRFSDLCMAKLSPAKLSPGEIFPFPVLSQTMCLKCRTISNNCRWFREKIITGNRYLCTNAAFCPLFTLEPMIAAVRGFSAYGDNCRCNPYRKRGKLYRSGQLTAPMQFVRPHSARRWRLCAAATVGV